MNKEQVISVIEQALNVANQKGVFNLQDSATIFSALTIMKNNMEFVFDKGAILSKAKEEPQVEPVINTKPKTTKNG